MLFLDKDTRIYTVYQCMATISWPPHATTHKIRKTKLAESSWSLGLGALERNFLVQGGPLWHCQVCPLFDPCFAAYDEPLSHYEQLQKVRATH